MIVVPFLNKENSRGPVVLVIILEKENLERMRAADPADVKLSTLPAPITLRLVRDLDVVVAYEEDHDKIVAFAKKQDLPGLLAWLERGRKMQPGDLAPLVRAT